MVMSTFENAIYKTVFKWSVILFLMARHYTQTKMLKMVSVFYHFSNISFTKKDTQRPTLMEVALRSAHIFYLSYAQYILPLTKFVLTECDDGCKRLDKIASFQP